MNRRGPGSARQKQRIRRQAGRVVQDDLVCLDQRIPHRGKRADRPSITGVLFGGGGSSDMADCRMVARDTARNRSSIIASSEE